MKNPLLTTVFLLAAMFCFAQSGSVTVTSVQQRTDGSGFVDIYFNLSGPASAYNIGLEVSFDAGSTYEAVLTNFLGGDVSGINTGSNMHIVWDGLGSFPNIFTTQAKLKLTATAAGSGTYGNFSITLQTHNYNTDWDAVVLNEFGSYYRVADWNDLVNFYNSGGDLLELFDALGLIEYGSSSFVYRNGQQFYSSTRAYFASRHEHNKPPNYLAHENIDNFLISLGSWYGARKIMVITDGGGAAIPCPGMPTFTDSRDGQTYNTVQIGSQCWMKENLNFQVGESWCYANNTSNCVDYGRLYIWNAALTACPSGWHLPSDSEWSQLTNYVATQGYPNSNVTNGAGNALKSCRQVYSPLGGDCNTTVHPRWDYHSIHHGFDEFGFSALPGGFRVENGVFLYLGSYGLWWSSTENSSSLACNQDMLHYAGNVSLN